MVRLGAVTLSRCSAFGGSAVIIGGAGMGLIREFRARGRRCDERLSGWSDDRLPLQLGHAIHAPGLAVVTVHGPVSLLPAGPGGPITGGPTSLAGFPSPTSRPPELSPPPASSFAAQPVAITFDGLIPFAPFSCILDFTPSFSFAFASIALGELLVPVPTSTFDATLDASGSFQLFLTPSLAVPFLTDIPLFLQFGVFDIPNNQIRLSNFHTRVFRN